MLAPLRGGGDIHEWVFDIKTHIIILIACFIFLSTVLLTVTQ